MIDPICDYYAQDVITPMAIFHGCDFGHPDRATTGKPDYTYTFIDYYFVEGGRQIFARHYTHSPGEVSLDIALSDLHSPLAEKVLLFLGLRYTEITCSDEALPAEIADALKARIEAHVRERGM